LCDKATEIHYYWEECKARGQNPGHPVHLTTYSPPESTYRPISIPLPAEANIGEQWRLCLCDASSVNRGSGDCNELLYLSSSKDEVLPISVWSEPIVTRPDAVPAGVVKGIAGSAAKSKDKGKADERDKRKGKGKEKEKERDGGVKQTRITREWASPDGRVLKIIEQTSFDLDKVSRSIARAEERVADCQKIWDSGLALSSWLQRKLAPGGDGRPEVTPTGPQDRVAPVLKLLREADSLDILELGA
jgi:hypothetical protein